MLWIQDTKTGKLHRVEDWPSLPKATYTVIPDIGDFETPTGEVLNGRKALREDLAARNCHVLEGGERQEIERRNERDGRQEARALRARIAEIAAERGLGRPD